VLRCGDLGRADLTGARFDRVSAADVSFARTALTGASLVSSRFTRCSFQGALLANADLSGTVFEDCDLSFASLEGARLMNGTRFLRCDLDMCDLSGAVVAGQRFTSDGGARSTEEVFDACRNWATCRRHGMKTPGQ
jgi:uncharacterized protein YjbI with pentapeptide repeats